MNDEGFSSNKVQETLNNKNEGENEKRKRHINLGMGGFNLKLRSRSKVQFAGMNRIFNLLILLTDK